jgi:DNA-binding phage protein
MVGSPTLARMRVDEEAIGPRFAALSPYLDERQRRLWLGVEAREAGHGGVSAVARATGMSRPSVAKAVKELSAPVEALPAG